MNISPDSIDDMIDKARGCRDKEGMSYCCYTKEISHSKETYKAIKNYVEQHHDMVLFCAFNRLIFKAVKLK